MKLKRFSCLAAVFFCVLLLFSTTSAGTFDVKYEADVLPQNAATVWSKVALGTITEEVISGQLHLKDSTTSDAVYYEQNGVVDSSASTVLEARVKVIGGTVNSAGTSIGFINLADDSKRIQIGIDTNKIFSSDNQEYLIDMTDYHTITLVKHAQTSWTCFVDGIKVLEGTSFISPYKNRSSFGHGTSVNTGESYWDYVYFSSNYTMAAPTDLTALAGDSEIDLSWNSISDASSYNIYRSTTPGGPFETPIATVDSSTVSYSDADIAIGTRYYYAVTSVKYGIESYNSNEVNAIILEPQRAFLKVTMTNGFEKEYDLFTNEVTAFINWYDNRANGIGKSYYIFNKQNPGPFTSRKEYLIFDKILTFEVEEYNR